MNSDIPKALHTVCGRPIIQYVLDITKGLGSLKTYVVLGHKGGTVKTALNGKLIYVTQTKLLGTADAVKCTKSHFRSYRGDVLILSGDTPLLKLATVKRLVQRHKRTDATCTFLTAVVHNPKGYGRVIKGESGAAVAIREDKDTSGYEREIAEINVGVYCCRSKELFSALKAVKINAQKKEFYLTDIIEFFAQQGQRIETVETEDPSEGLGVNTREDLATAESVVRREILKGFMIQGVTIIDPGTTYIDAGAKIGIDTVIQPFTFIERDVRIGSHCRIGPFARLRPGTRIEDKVEIGNFTEISRTRVGTRVFMKHFSFLGDASVGADVNIGAGVITANFDGQKKNKTKISAGAFIGSDVVLIAPVKIGKKAVIGAGSVVTKGKSIPDGGVAVGIPAKIISKGRRP